MEKETKTIELNVPTEGIDWNNIYNKPLGKMPNQIDKDGFIYLKGRAKNMILGASGQNIYPEEIESRLNNLPFVDESLVIEKNGKLIALVHPDYEAIDARNLDEISIVKKMEENRKALNAILPAYSFITKIDLYAQEFEKTPTKKIKRFLYYVTQ